MHIVKSAVYTKSVDSLLLSNRLRGHSINLCMTKHINIFTNILECFADFGSVYGLHSCGYGESGRVDNTD